MKTRAGGPDRHGRVPAVTEVVIDRRHRAVWKSCVFSRSRKAQELALHAPNLWRLLDQRERRDTEEERRARQPPDLRCFAEPLVPPEREGAPRAPTLVDPIRSINPGGQTTGRASLRRILSVAGACASFGPERADHARAHRCPCSCEIRSFCLRCLDSFNFPRCGRDTASRALSRSPEARGARSAGLPQDTSACRPWAG